MRVEVRSPLLNVSLTTARLHRLDLPRQTGIFANANGHDQMGSTLLIEAGMQLQ